MSFRGQTCKRLGSRQGTPIMTYFKAVRNDRTRSDPAVIARFALLSWCASRGRGAKTTRGSLQLSNRLDILPNGVENRDYVWGDFGLGRKAFPKHLDLRNRSFREEVHCIDTIQRRISSSDFQPCLC